MDFPAVEKCYSHVETRLAIEQGLVDSGHTSPTSSISVDDRFDLPGPPLVTTTTQASRPALSRNITQISRPALTRDLSRFTTHGTAFTTDPSFEVDWEDDDPGNPRNWSVWYKSLTLCFISFSTLVVVLYSTAYTSAIGTIMEEFHVTDKAAVTLGLTTYLIGLAVGSVILAPISETYGRKPVYMITMFLFAVLVIPCAKAPNVTTLVVTRFFGAVAGSAMIANAPGSIGDIISEDYRSIAFSIWSVGPMNGPVIGPLVGGYVTQYLGWRWLHWIVFILGVVAFAMMVFVKETYSPALLQAKTKRLRKERGEDRYWCQYDVKVSFWVLMKVNLSRPFVMAVTEPICIFWNVYIAIIYSILYLCFASYPIIYHEQRGWSIGQSSLAFLGIGVGTMITICCASPIKKMINAHKPDESGHVPPESMMSVVCIAAILVPVGELWFAWTCLPARIHPAISIAAGIPFGAGNGAIFIYASNYLVGSYGIYAASALAGNSVIRSVLGGVLPLAGAPMYAKLGANWAGTLLGLLEVAFIPVPFIFYRYGHKIRQKSALISEMREIEEKQERRKKKAELRAARMNLAEADVVVVDKNVFTMNKEVGPEGQHEPRDTVLDVTIVDEKLQAAAELSRNAGVIKEKREEV